MKRILAYLKRRSKAKRMDFRDVFNICPMSSADYLTVTLKINSSDYKLFWYTQRLKGLAKCFGAKTYFSHENQTATVHFKNYEVAQAFSSIFEKISEETC